MIDFPNTPLVGDTHTVDTMTWRWDGVKWTADASIVSAADLSAYATIVYVDQVTGDISTALTAINGA